MVTANLFGYFVTPKVGIKQVWEVIGKFDFPITENGHTFDFSPVNFVDNSMIVIVGEMSPETNDCLIMSINGVTTGGTWTEDGIRIKGGVETIIDINGQDFYSIATNTLLSSSGRPIHFIVYITLDQQNNNVGVQSLAQLTTFVGGGGMEHITGKSTTVLTTINAIRIQLRIRNIEKDSRMTIYKVSR